MTEHYALSGKDNWITPPWLIEMIERHVEITLDPCASPKTHYGKINYRLEDGIDGLESEWFGNVFVNPPFKLSLKKKWTKKVLEKREATDLIILLLPDSTDVQSWFHGRVTEADYVWFSNGRIKFIDPEDMEPKNQPTFGTTLSFFGEIPDGLKDELRESGWLVISC